MDKTRRRLVVATGIPLAININLHLFSPACPHPSRQGTSHSTGSRGKLRTTPPPSPLRLTIKQKLTFLRSTGSGRRFRGTIGQRPWRTEEVMENFLEMLVSSFEFVRGAVCLVALLESIARRLFRCAEVVGPTGRDGAVLENLRLPFTPLHFRFSTVRLTAMYSGFGRNPVPNDTWNG